MVELSEFDKEGLWFSLFSLCLRKGATGEFSATGDGVAEAEEELMWENAFNIGGALDLNFVDFSCGISALEL